MCGIVGYTGPREAGPILIAGLQRLEYRGYDSAGIALVDDAGDLFVEKRAGKLANLQTALVDRMPHAAIGLAHTRWATHGRPNDLNAHPHQDCTGDITVIHNGIIENFRELRDGLEARGHRLTSETDTEALAHLVEEAYAGDLADAVRDALGRAVGAYAIAVMHRGEPDRLVGARQDVPLVVGLGDGETFLASDVAAILAHTDRVIFLAEGDVADLRPDGVTITGIDGVARPHEVTVIDWSPEAAEKGGYETFMLKEIHEQPQALAQSIAGRVGRDDRILGGELDGMQATLRSITRIELVACGTASYAALAGAAALEAWTGLPARVTVGSEFRYSPPPLDEHTLVIAVTQSGETADTIAPTRLARERGCPIVAVTNTVGSAITREADAVMFLQAGPEIAVAASKTFVTQVTTLIVLAATIAKIRGTMTEDAERELGAALRALPAGAARAIDAAEAGAADLARRYVNSRGFMFVGRGPGYPVALEGALKLKEVSYVHAEGYAAGELEARSDLAAGRRVPAGRGRDPVRGVRQADQQRDGRSGPRCAGHRRRDRGRCVDRAVRRRRVLGAGHARDAERRARHHPAPAVRLSRRGRSRHGRGPATQPGEVRHGRIGDGPDRRPVRRSAPARGGPARDDRARHRHHQGGPDPGDAGAVRLAVRRPRADARRTALRARPSRDDGRQVGRQGGRVQGAGARGPGDRLARHRSGASADGPALGPAAWAGRPRAEQLGMGRIALSITHESDYAVAIAFGVRTAGGRYVFPLDIDERLDERERRILARIERLRDAAQAGGAGALASDAPPASDGDDGRG